MHAPYWIAVFAFFLALLCAETATGIAAEILIEELRKWRRNRDEFIEMLLCDERLVGEIQPHHDFLANRRIEDGLSGLRIEPEIELG